MESHCSILSINICSDLFRENKKYKFAVKVYKYFNTYSVRVEELKNFCDFAGNNYTKLVEHVNTRFLSLGPSIDRILSMFDGLRSYFLSQEKCSYVVKIV
jgi:hypothetical protein